MTYCTRGAAPLIADWESFRSAQLSDNGQWFGCALAPNAGSGEVVMRRQVAAAGRELRFPVGDAGDRKAIYDAFRKAAVTIMQ